MKKSFAILLLPLLLMSCSVKEFDIPGFSGNDNTPADADSMGFFQLTLTSQTATRATSTTLSPEEADNFLITVRKGTDVVRSRQRLADLDTRLSAGYGYTVQAESCTEEDAESSNEGWGQKRFAGLSGSFAIKAGETTSVNVGCSVANAGVELSYDKSLLNYFTSIEVTVTKGDRILRFTTSGQTAYFNTDAEDASTAAYTIKAEGPDGTINKEGTLNLTKAKMSRINLAYEIGTFTLSVLVEMADIEDEEVVISEDDIQTDDGNTEANATFAGYAENARTDINTYGQTAVSLTAASPIDWAQTEASVAVYDETGRHSFSASTVENAQRIGGSVTPKTRDFLAAYPYSQVGEALSDGKIVFTVPAEQRALTVAPGAQLASSRMNYAVAKGLREYDGRLLNLTFRPVCQLLQFQVPAYAAARIKAIQFKAAVNVAGQLNVDYSSDAPSAAIASSGSQSVTILPPTGETAFAAGTYYILTAPVQMNGFSMTFECGDTDYTLSGTSSLGGEAGKIYPLGYVDLVNNVTVSDVGHIYANGVLQGTNLKVSSFWDNEWTAEVVRNSDNSVLRSFNGTGDFVSAATDASWPYLPKGNYTVRCKLRTSNGVEYSQELNPTIPAPDINVTLGGYTSYTKYQDGDVDYANNSCERATIYNPSGSVNISDAILSNPNYNSLCSFGYTFAGSSTTLKTNSFALGNKTSQALGSHPFRISMTFDGTDYSKERDLYISGLPVNFNPPTQATGWSNDDGTTNFESEYVRLGNYSWSQPHRIKNDSWVKIPSGVKLALDYDIVLHRGAVNTTANVKAGEQLIVEVTDSSYGDDVHNTGSKTITTNAEVTKLTCEGSYGSGATHTKVYKLYFKYGK